MSKEKHYYYTVICQSYIRSLYKVINENVEMSHRTTFLPMHVNFLQAFVVFLQAAGVTKAASLL